MNSRLSSFAILGFALLVAGCGSIKTGPIGESSGASTAAYGYMSEARQGGGLSPVSPDSRLERAALQQARYMAAASSMRHTTRFGRDFATRMRKNEVRGAAAENIANGSMPMAEVFARWEASAPHRRNMLDPRFSRYGLASATDAKGRRYWALVMGE